MRRPRLRSTLTTEQSNYLVAVANGVFIRTSMNLVHPGLVLSVFVRALGGSNVLVGSLSAVRFAGWFLPQFLVASWLQPLRRKRPVAVALEIVRLACYAILGILTYFLGVSSPGLLLAVFFPLFIISRLVAGAGALARTDIIAKTIAPKRRASFFATRSFWGGVGVFAAGFLVSFVLRETEQWPFPSNFTLLFAISTIGLLVGLWFLGRVEEPQGPAGLPQHSLREQLARAPQLLKEDAVLRRYMLIRTLLSMTRLSAPFYPILALDVLDAPEAMVGFYMSAMTLSLILANPLWQRLSQQRSTAHLLRVSALLSAVEPLAALALPWIMRWAGFTTQRNGLLPAYLFAVVFLIAGSAESGRAIGLMCLLLDIAPEAERASYVGLVNTVLGFVSLLPIFAGAIIDRIGFEPIFGLATLMLAWGYVATLRWKGAQRP
jgi:MFS family permease